MFTRWRFMYWLTVSKPASCPSCLLSRFTTRRERLAGYEGRTTSNVVADLLVLVAGVFVRFAESPCAVMQHPVASAHSAVASSTHVS